MQQLHPIRNQAALAWLHHDMRSVLHTLGSVSETSEELSGSDAGVCQSLPWRTDAGRDLRLRPVDPYETPLSDSEIAHGIRHGLISRSVWHVAVGVA